MFCSYERFIIYNVLYTKKISYLSALKTICFEEFKKINDHICLTIEHYSYDCGLVTHNYSLNSNKKIGNKPCFVYFANFTKQVKQKNDSYCIGPPTIRGKQFLQNKNFEN